MGITGGGVRKASDLTGVVDAAGLAGSAAQRAQVNKRRRTIVAPISRVGLIFRRIRKTDNPARVIDAISTSPNITEQGMRDAGAAAPIGSFVSVTLILPQLLAACNLAGSIDGKRLAIIIWNGGEFKRRAAAVVPEHGKVLLPVSVVSPANDLA